MQPSSWVQFCMSLDKNGVNDTANYAYENRITVYETARNIVNTEKVRKYKFEIKNITEF